MNPKEVIGSGCIGHTAAALAPEWLASGLQPGMPAGHYGYGTCISNRGYLIVMSLEGMNMVRSSSPLPLSLPGYDASPTTILALCRHVAMSY